MSATFGFVGGVLALTALEAVVSSRGATNNVTGLLGASASLIRHLSDPTVPAIPDLSKGAGSAGPPTVAPGPPGAPSTLPPGAAGAGYGATQINPKTGASGALFT